MCLFFFVALFLQLQRRHMKRCKEKDAFSLQANFFQTHINAHTQKKKEKKERTRISARCSISLNNSTSSLLPQQNDQHTYTPPNTQAKQKN